MYSICQKHIHNISVAYCPDCTIDQLRTEVTHLEGEVKELEARVITYAAKLAKEDCGCPCCELTKEARADSKRFRDALEKIASDDNTVLMEYFEVGQTAPSLPRIYEDIACKALIDTEGKEGL
jgi:hypothetical protein